MEYRILIIGSDANAYYMARCYHEAYHKKADVLAKSPLPYTAFSDILKLSYDSSIWNEDGFLKAVYRFKAEHGNLPVLLISSNESYAAFISKNREQLQRDGFLFNYPEPQLLDSFMMKEKFYKAYCNSCLKVPKTFYYNCAESAPFCETMTYPVILKPSNVILYNHLTFDGKHKIYQIDSPEELQETIQKITAAGYNDTLIIQDFIPGDDFCLFDAVAYVNTAHEVKLLSFAQIGLQEHSKNMVGNAAVLINGYNQFGGTAEIEADMKEFLEAVGYQGFCEFDLKYDARDNTFKVLEINARQGRSSYYLTPLGFNPVKVLVEDLIEHKEMPYTFLKDEVLLSFVPKGILKKYISNKAYREKALTLWRTAGHVSPVQYKADKNLKRRLYLLKKHFRYYREYRHSEWKNR